MVVLSEVNSMFWGVTLDGGKRYTQTVEHGFHISMAALEPSQVKGDSGVVSVMLQHDKAEFLLCTLSPNKQLQQPLDLNFTDGEDVTFFLNGNGVVHLTGYLVIDDYPSESMLEDAMGEEDSEELTDEDDSDDDSDPDSPPNLLAMQALVGKRKLVAAGGAKHKKLRMEVDDDDDDDDTDDDDYDVDEDDDFGESFLDEEDNDDDDDDDSMEEDEEEEDEDEDGDMELEALLKKSGGLAELAKKVKGQTPKKSEKGTPNKKGKDSPAKSKDTPSKGKDTPSKGKDTPSKNKDTPAKGKDTPKKDKQKEPQANGTPAKAKGTPAKVKGTPAKVKGTPQPQSDSSPEKNPDTPSTDKKKKKKKKNKGEESPQTPSAGGQQSKPGTPTSGQKKAAKRVLDGGLVVEDAKEGHGPPAKDGKMVHVYYTGKLPNGKVFDSCTSGKPLKFRLGKAEVIKGWDRGLSGMKVGGKRKLTIPANLGYGSKGSGPIPANSQLIFDVELKSVS